MTADGAGAHVGFIGLGVMGRPMAHRLLSSGYRLVVHSRSPAPVDELVEAGAARAGTPAEVAASSDVVITMLPDTPDVKQVLFAKEGVAEGIRSGSLMVDMSTVDPLATREFARDLQVEGVDFLDAPVSGGEKGAMEGTLSIMVGGSGETLARAMPLFHAMGKTVTHIGEVGAGQIAKACNQLVVASTIEAVAEALVLAEQAGVDPRRVREALLGGFAASRVLEVHGERMLNRDFQPGFRARLHLKDARIILGAAGELGAPVRTFETVALALERLVEDGGGDLDHSALYEMVARDSRGNR